MEKLTTIESWHAAKAESYTGPVIIFKHSSICAASARVFALLMEALNEKMIKSLVYIVTVPEDRSLSNQIVEETGVRHETPQVIIIKNGATIYDADHAQIIIDDILRHLV